MFKIKLRRFFIIIILVLPGASFASQDNLTDLETLVITKQKQFLLNTYSVKPSENNKFNYQSAVEDLRILPIDLQSRALTSGIQTDFSLRGSTYSQVLILLNGQRVNDPQTGHHNSDIPFTKEDIKRVEVIPGAGSSLFGPDAIGGAINFMLVTPKEKRAVWEFGAGNNRNGYGLFSMSDSSENLGFRFSVEDAQSKGYRYDTEYKKFTTSLGASLQLPDGVWENNLGYQEKEFGAYDFYTPGLGYPSQEWTRTYLVNSGLTLDKDGLLIKPNFLWRRHFDKFALNRTIASYNKHHTDIFTPNIYLQKEAGFLGKVGLGLEWGQEKIISTNLGKHDRDHRSIFLDDTRPIGQKWDLGFSLRLDDFSDFDMVYTGSASLKFKLADTSALNFGISRSMRIPSFTELYYSDSAKVPTIGNPDLAAEKVWNYQLGYEYKQEWFSWNLALFLRQEHDMIDWVRPDSTQPWQARNFTRDNVFGFEYSLHKKINRLLSCDANYTYTDKAINSQGYLYKYGPNYARHLVNTVFNLDLPFGQQEIGFNYKKQPGRRGWLLLNAGLSYNLNKNSKIFLSSTNILNVEYQDIEGIPQPGRYIQAGLRLAW
jgi:iron complex outermembrane receptor protein